MNRLTLSQRLSLVFCALLLVCCGALAWIQMRSTRMHEQETVQRLSRGLAEHIARSSELMDARGMRDGEVRALFGKLMAVNPSVEVYLLDDQGRILGHDAPDGHLRRDRVDLAPVRALLAGAPLPILGDDPRSRDGRKVFNAAPLRVQGRQVGYIYVVLVGEQREALAADIAASASLRTTLWSLAVVAAVGLLAGIVAFRWITRPLRRLTRDIQAFDVDAGVPAPPAPSAPPRPGGRDELAILQHSFAHMAQRIGEQWRQLRQQDQQRRELVANISHDLRTPLSSLHGYLETLALKDATLGADERRRYLSIALAQSEKVGRLAQALFELARLEHGGVVLEPQAFSLPDLVQDVFQKFELAAQARRQSLVADIPAGLPAVHADLGLVERVLTNLLDNALRHTPEGGRIAVALRAVGDDVEVRVADTGPGIAPERRAQLFSAPSALDSRHPGSGGLGLLIVHRILQLHHRRIELAAGDAGGAEFVFSLAAASRRPAPPG
ncbi:HAMP domain-containing protein [Stenotrophomonas sp. MYb238]|uniref:sensor histidine kinase n=1 Tax=Stenotrophomonas sp. MYb238 TaxID=2040281 RepID=UPI0012915AB1|nr:ATP-binding protein [Stenotrophomonas sp. MYb238]MQP75306.1 HAMP domain-containing protein [Stenotrophomonas sp. MYb238]